MNDLPPKIIQDYYCELSDLQKSMYDRFATSPAKQDAEDQVQKSNGDVDKSGKQHVFQSLQYLRKLCNHPALVDKNTPSQDIENAPKLLALKYVFPFLVVSISFTDVVRMGRQLLHDCGIGKNADDGGDGADSPHDPLDATTDVAVSQHRVLIFCQLKQMLDIIEKDLFKAHMPTVTYMRLDGSTEPNKRHAVVQTFNGDPSIDCLLLTTHVGGLGLTLTGADTVIFVEHDWNPMKDLQAMDRAHRLGQKKVVNVYRLITRGTLEEKIMGYVSFHVLLPDCC